MIDSISADIRLMEFVRSEVGRPFEWGETNCLALALRAVDAMRGTTLHATHRHRMSSAARALAGTRKHGLDGVVRFLQQHGLIELAPNFAQEGDILLGLSEDGQIAAHVSLGTRVLSSTPDDGVILLRLATVSPAPTLAAGWRAG